MLINASQSILPKSKLQIFLDRYQVLLSIAATFLFFSEIPDYLFEVGLLPLNVLGWIGIFAALALPFARKIVTMPKSLIIGLVIYGTISFLSLMTVSADEVSTQDFRNRILSIFFVCLMYVIYEQRSLKPVRYALIAAVILAVVNNFYELANPFVFSPLNVGRPAGLYVNPTKTGAALMLGMLLTITAIAKPLRWLFMLFVGMGILVTFTRGAILGWLIAIVLLIGGRVLSDKRRRVILPMLIFVSFLVVINPLSALSNYFSGGIDGSYSNVLERLEQFQNPDLADHSAQDRKAVAREAWKMFGERPFWGNGLGSTNKWTVAPFSTHNMYLYYMVDNGIIGLIFLPGAIFAVVYNNKGEQKIILICYAVCMGLWGIFSHNVLEERYILITLSLLAAMNTNQRQYSQYFANKFQLALPPAKAQLLLPPVRNQRALPPANYRKTFPPIDR